MAEKCPYNCVDGWIINPYKHKKEQCPHCRDIRHKEVLEGGVAEKLNLPPSYTSYRFEPDAVFPSYIEKYMEMDSVSDIKEVMQDLMNNIMMHELPKHSMLFNLGAKVMENNFLCPLLVKAYEVGFSVVPIIDTPMLIKSRLNYESGAESDEVISFSKIVQCDICVVSIDAGSSYKGIMAAKGIMQLRARSDKPTIIVTHSKAYEVNQLCTEDGNNCYNLATYYTVQYKEKAETGGSNIPRQSSSQQATSSEVTIEQLRNMGRKNSYL